MLSKYAFTMYGAALDELMKIGYREAPWMTPAQRAHWSSMQGAEAPLPTQVEPAFARSRQQMRRTLEGQPLIGSHVELGAGQLAKNPAVARMAQTRQAVVGQRLQQSGQAFKGVPGLEKQITNIPGHSRVPTRTGAEVHGAPATVPNPKTLPGVGPAFDKTVASPIRGVAKASKLTPRFSFGRFARVFR